MKVQANAAKRIEVEGSARVVGGRSGVTSSIATTDIINVA